MKKKIFIAASLAAALAVGLWLWGVYSDGASLRAADKAVREACLWDMSDLSISFYLPYGSRVFTPTDIPSGRGTEEDFDALTAFLSSMKLDREASGSACKSGNTLISVTLPKGNDRLVLTVTDDDICYAQASRGREWLEAAYTFDGDARDALLARGGLPTAAEIKEAVQNRFNELETDVPEQPVLK